MSEEMKQALEQFAARLLQEGTNAIDFTKEQVPLLVQEFLRWKVAESAMHVGVGVVLVLVALMLFKQAAKWIREELDSDSYDPPIKLFGGIFAGIGGVILAGPMALTELLYVFPLAKAIFAPRLVVLDFVRGLL